MSTHVFAIRSALIFCLAAYTTSATGFAQQQMLGAGSPPSSSGVSAALPAEPPPAAGAAASPEPVTRAFVMPRNFHIAPSVTYSTVPGKMSYYLATTVSVRVLAEAVAIAGIPNITSSPSQPQLSQFANDPDAAQDYQNAMQKYGNQMDAWLRTNDVILRYHGYRFEAGAATAETRMLLSNLALPLALHQQARYKPAPMDASLPQRLWNATESLVVTRDDNGFLMPNCSKLGGTVGAALLGKEVYANTFNAPELDSGHFVGHYIGYSLLGDLATNVGHELVRAAVSPDMALYSMHGGASDDSYYPLSLGGKVVYWGRSAYSLRNFGEGALMAGVPQVTHQPIEPQADGIETPAQRDAYNSAYQSWGIAELAWKQQLETQLRYREHAFIGGFSESETQMLLQNLVIPIGFDMDPRYLPLGPGHPTAARLGHALRGLVMTHTDSGTMTVNAPVLGGAVGAAFIAKAIYYPQLGTTSLETGSVLAKTISLNLVADGIGNIYREFFSRRAY